MKAIHSVILAAALFVSLVSAAEVTIQVGNPAGATNPEKFQFSPRVLRVQPTDTVTFVFNGNHSVTQQGNFTLCTPGVTPGSTAAVQPFDSQVLSKGQTWPLPASALVPGSILYYYCKVGAGAHCNGPNYMQGALVVAGAPTGTAGSPAANPASPPSTPAPAAAAQTITVSVGQGGNNFAPAIVNAAPGDTILFSWVGGTHDVVPSDAPQSCTKSTKADTDEVFKALASGPPKSSGEHLFVVPANAAVGTKLWYYCSVGNHCSGDKMYGTINIVDAAAGSAGPGSGVAGGNGTSTGAVPTSASTTVSVSAATLLISTALSVFVFFN